MIKWIKRKLREREERKNREFQEEINNAYREGRVIVIPKYKSEEDKKRSEIFAEWPDILTGRKKLTEEEKSLLKTKKKKR